MTSLFHFEDKIHRKNSRAVAIPLLFPLTTLSGVGEPWFSR